MEFLAEVAIAIFIFLIEVTFHAAVFIFLLLMAAFSPKYRSRLREKWDTSGWHRFGLVLGVALYSCALVLALCFWTPFLGREELVATDEKPAATIELTGEELQRIRQTKEIGDLVDVAGEILKRKATEKKEEPEKD